MDSDSFIVYMKTEDIYVDIAKDVETWLGIQLKKVIGLMKDELGDKIMKEFAVLRPRTYSY